MRAQGIQLRIPWAYLVHSPHPMGRRGAFTTYDDVAAAVVALAPDGAIRYGNRAWLALSPRQGRRRSRRFWELVPRPDEAAAARAALDRLAREGGAVRFECSWVTGDEPRVIAFSGSARDGARGRIDHLLLIGVEADRASLAATPDPSRLRDLLQLAPDGIFVADLDGRYTDVNDAGCRMLGYERDEIIGRTILDLIPPEDSGRLWTSREHLLRGEVDVSEWTLRRKDGSYLAVEVSAKILPDGRWQGLVRDVSDRRRYQDALRLSEQRLRVSLQASPAIMFNQDRDLRYTWAHNLSPPMSPESVIGRTDADLLPAADAGPVIAIKRRVLESGIGAREVVRVTMAGEARYYDLTVEPLRDGAGQIVGVTCATWNVTEQRRAAERQRLLAQVGEVVAGTTPDFETTLAELGRLATAELADWAILDVLEDGQVRRLKVACADPSKHALVDEIEKLDLDRRRPHLVFEPLEHGRAVLVPSVTAEELRRVAQSARHLQLLEALGVRSLMAVPLLARGRRLGALAFVSARESRRFDEEDLRFAEAFARIAALAVDNAQAYRAVKRAIAARDEVLGMVAHDLRNPLNGILLQAQVLRSRDGEAELRDHRPLDAIHRAALRMNRLIDDILDVARLDAGTLAIRTAPQATGHLLDEVLEAQRGAVSLADLRLRVDSPDQLPPVLADRDRILQVFDNLIGNAIRFTPEGGEIVIGAEPAPGAVRFWVADSGRGIPAEQVGHLFDRFWRAEQADRRGTGLGLAIVKGIIEAHRGQVRVESTVGRGTTFSFTLPVAARRSARVAPPPG